MDKDPKRELLRHMLATVWFRMNIAIADAPPSFAEFRAAETTRSAGEIFAHINDLIRGTHILLQGKSAMLKSDSRSWQSETLQFRDAVEKLDRFLATDAPLAYPVEKFIQGPIGDALTHVGQIVMLRRIAGLPIRQEPYFTAEIVPGEF